jgi:hypothetical protein
VKAAAASELRSQLWSRIAVTSSLLSYDAAAKVGNPMVGLMKLRRTWGTHHCTVATICWVEGWLGVVNPVGCEMMSISVVPVASGVNVAVPEVE